MGQKNAVKFETLQDILATGSQLAGGDRMLGATGNKFFNKNGAGNHGTPVKIKKNI
jgi:hypothetical protein